MKITYSNKKINVSNAYMISNMSNDKKILMRCLKNNSGFSLIETIITIVIIGIVTVPITMTFIGSLQDTAIAKEQLKATHLAQLCIENIKAKSDQDIMTFFNTDPVADGLPYVREITANQGYVIGFPNIPEGYKVRLNYDKSTTLFNQPEYLLNGGTSLLNYDATISFEEGMGKAFEVGNGTETDRFEQELATIDRVIYLVYEYDSNNVLIQDDSDKDNVLKDFSVGDLNPINFAQSSYNVLINCSDTSALTTPYLTKIYVVNETPTPVNLFIYQNPLTTVALSINDSEGRQEGVVNTYYNMQEYIDETHKIYVVGVEVYNDDNVMLSKLETTKVIE